MAGSEAWVAAEIRDVLASVAASQEGSAVGDAVHSRGPHGAAPQQQQQLEPQQEHQLEPQQVAPAGTAELLDVPGNAEATVRLLRARLRSLEEQLALALGLNQERDAELAEAQKALRLAAQKDSAAAKAQKTLEAQVERHRRAAEAAREALASKEQQLKELSKEGAKADKDRRQQEQESHARDVRLQRALEEVDKYKQLLQDVKAQGQETKDVARSEHVKVLADCKRLERQRAELLAVLRKQAKLVDLLRRQRAHLEAARLLGFTEDEFLRTLDAGSS